MKKYIDTFLRAVITGVLIGIGGIVYLSCDNKYVGSFLFATGLFTILTFKFSLFTGKVGYAVENKPSYLVDLLVIWVGNFIGTLLTGLVIQLTRVGAAISEKAAGLCGIKLADDLLSIFVLAVFCGMLMFIAADGYKTLTNPTAQTIVIFIAVMVFILSGFEHCVANMFYFSAANMWNMTSFLYLIVMSLGNAAGGIMIPLFRKGFIKEK